jgi:hypothetical protein
LCLPSAAFLSLLIRSFVCFQLPFSAGPRKPWSNTSSPWQKLLPDRRL